MNMDGLRMSANTASIPGSLRRILQLKETRADCKGVVVVVRRIQTPCNSVAISFKSARPPLPETVVRSPCMHEYRHGQDGQQTMCRIQMTVDFCCDHSGLVLQQSLVHCRNIRRLKTKLSCTTFSNTPQA